MINVAMFQTRDAMNEFTISLSRMCEVEGSQVVRLRNKTLMRVQYVPPNPRYKEDASFMANDYEYCWFLDGSSCKNSDLDIVAMGGDV